MAKTSNRTKREPDAVANCTGLNLRKATRAVSQLYDETLAPTGLRGTQFSVLAATAKNGPLAMSALADRLVTDRTTLTRNLRPLEARGLLAVIAGEDRRERLVTITPAGEKALKAARPYWRKAQAHMVDGLGQGQWRELLSGLAGALTVARRR